MWRRGVYPTSPTLVNDEFFKLSDVGEMRTGRNVVGDGKWYMGRLYSW